MPSHYSFAAEIVLIYQNLILIGIFFLLPDNARALELLNSIYFPLNLYAMLLFYLLL
jgi:hypothetical protein